MREADQVNQGAEPTSPILLTGAAGRTGRAVLAQLVARGVKVRAFVRREAAGAEMLAAGAHDLVCGDLEKSDDLRRGLEGCASLLHICPPMHPREDRIAVDMIALCKGAGVARMVLYSVLHPVINVPHHRRKLVAEEALVGSGLDYTILQPSRYMQHLASIWREVLDLGIHAMPFSIEARFSLVDLNDLAEATARVLCESGHEGATYELAGPEQLSQNDCAAIISQVLGRKVTARRRSPQEVLAAAQKANVPATRIGNMLTMNRHYDEHGLTGNPNVLHWLLGREPVKFRDYVARLTASG